MAEKESTAITTVLANDKALGQIFVDSGFFQDTKKESEAIVKILAGREAGLQPIESMTGIHIIKGKISFGANMMAAAVKKHPNYDYRVTEHTEKKCSIDFFEVIDGKREKIGTSSFTIEEASKIGLTQNTTWKNYPKAMLFARALSAGVRYYCPDVFGHAPVYVPEELGARVDEDGEPIDITPKAISEPEESPIVEHTKKIEAEEQDDTAPKKPRGRPRKEPKVVDVEESPPAEPKELKEIP
ncbi:MAG: hypothetical protein PHC68_17675, partial [Syntrophorhabdaceae bacterium]|nr:hypothetical protein [Syntrophorhabdaceae bacterium]